MSNNIRNGLYFVFGENDFNENLQPITGVGKKIINQIISLNIDNVMSCKLVVFPSLGKKKTIYIN